jgi:hypothetical protein
MEYVISVPIIISLTALSISILTYIKKQKSDQFKIALDINYKLEEIDNKLLNTIEKFNRNSTPEQERQAIIKSISLEELNTLEFISFLVNNGEITNKNIIKYFTPTLCKVSEKVFEDYPDIKTNSSKFYELKKLLEKLNCEYDS